MRRFIFPYAALWLMLLLAMPSDLLAQENRYTSQPGELVFPSVPEAPGLLAPPPPLSPAGPSVVGTPSVFEQDASGFAPERRVAWYVPWTWWPMDGWKNSAEVGINGSAGNAESMSFQTGARLKRKTDFTNFDFRISHNRTNASGTETQNNALMYVDFERYLGNSKWTYFVKNGLEYDEFKSFDLRYNISSGLGYNFIQTEDLTLASRFGAGASREFGGPDNSWVPEALFGGDYEHQLTQRNKVILKVDYFPEWENFSNFRLVSDLAWEYLLDEDGNLSFKLGAVDRYDSTPNGAKPNDVNYSALLLYKF